jgi:hypothetical protein
MGFASLYPSYDSVNHDRHCEERSDEAIHASASGEMDCFRLRSLSYGGQVAPLAMTEGSYFPTHFGGRFSANAFGPSM